MKKGIIHSETWNKKKNNTPSLQPLNQKTKHELLKESIYKIWFEIYAYQYIL